MASAQEAIASYLDSEHFGTLGTSIFVDFKPSSPLACIAVIGYGGGEPGRGIGSKALLYKVSKVQVTVRNPSPGTAMSTANSIADSVEGLSSGEVISAHLVSGPFSLGRDSNDQSEYTINFEVKWR